MMIRCEGCNRRVIPMEMADVSNMPEFGELSQACSGCRERIFASGVLKRSEFFRRIGAPEKVLSKMREHENEGSF